MSESASYGTVLLSVKFCLNYDHKKGWYKKHNWLINFSLPFIYVEHCFVKLDRAGNKWKLKCFSWLISLQKLWCNFIIIKSILTAAIQQIVSVLLNMSKIWHFYLILIINQCIMNNEVKS